MNEAPADVLKDARQKILGLMDMGISRDALLNLVATSNPSSHLPNGSNIPQQPLPTQSTDEVSREVKTERPVDDGGFSRGMHAIQCPSSSRPFGLRYRSNPRSHASRPEGAPYVVVCLLTCE